MASPQHQKRRGAAGGRKVHIASLFKMRETEVVLASHGQRGLRISGNGHCGAMDLMQYRKQADDLITFSAVAHQNDHVVFRHHAQIAMHGFAGVHEKGWRSQARQRCRDLCSDVAGLSHTGDDHLARAVYYQPDDRLEIFAKAGFGRLQGSDLSVKHPLRFFYDIHVKSPYVLRCTPKSASSAASPSRSVAPCWDRLTLRGPDPDASP